MGRYEKLDELIEKAVDVRVKKKHYEKEYNKIRKEIEDILENELYATEYKSSSGTTVRITIAKRKQINMDKIRELLEIAHNAGYDITEDDLYTESKIKRFEILTPNDIERRRRFAKAREAGQ